MPSINLFYIFLTSLFASLILTPSMSRLAYRVGGIDYADERKIHSHHIPRLGGIAIVIAFILALLLFGQLNQQSSGFLAGVVIIFITGLTDDLFNLSPINKFLGQFAAVITGISIGHIEVTSLGNLFGAGNIELGPLAVPFTVIAMVGVINAINLIDGLDGLAGGVSVIAAFALGVLGFLTGNLTLMCLTAALLGAVTGFLKYNTHPATIFMGDSGSLFLGYAMAYFSVMLVSDGGGNISEATPLAILAVPIFDTIFVMMKRLRSGQKLFAPDRNHIHHRLMGLGVCHKYAVIIVYGLTYVLCIFAVLFHRLDAYVVFAGILAVLGLFWGTNSLLIKHWQRRKQHVIAGRRAIRQIAAYRRLVEQGRGLRVAAKYLLIAVLLLSVAMPTAPTREAGIVALLLILLVMSLFFMTNNWGNRFLKLVIYSSGAFIVFQMENLSRGIKMAGIPYPELSHTLFFMMFVIIGIKVILRRKTGKLMNSPLEFLLFFLVTSMLLLPEQLISKYHLMTVTGKTVILFAAYKFTLRCETYRNRKVIAATLVALVAFVAKNLIL